MLRVKESFDVKLNEARKKFAVYLVYYKSYLIIKSIDRINARNK